MFLIGIPAAIWSISASADERTVCLGILGLLLVSGLVVSLLSARNKRNKPSSIRKSIKGFLVTIVAIFIIVLIWLQPTSEEKTLWSQNSYPTVNVNAIAVTELPLVFCKSLETRIADYASIESCNAKINADGRLEADYVEIWLIRPKNWKTARDILEITLRTFAEIGQAAPGYVTVLVEWRRDDIQCSDNAGMGYSAMGKINWKTATQKEIFRALDQGVYGDLGESYKDIAWAPDSSGVEKCNE